MASKTEELMPIAIVGMSCRLPGNVSSPGEFWQLLSKARSGWSKIPKSRFNDAAYRHPNPEKKGTLNSTGGYFLNEDLEMFDPGFFDMTKKEAETMVRLIPRKNAVSLVRYGFARVKRVLGPIHKPPHPPKKERTS